MVTRVHLGLEGGQIPVEIEEKERQRRIERYEYLRRSPQLSQVYELWRQRAQVVPTRDVLSPIRSIGGGARDELWVQLEEGDKERSRRWLILRPGYGTLGATSGRSPFAACSELVRAHEFGWRAGRVLRERFRTGRTRCAAGSRLSIVIGGGRPGERTPLTGAGIGWAAVRPEAPGGLPRVRRRPGVETSLISPEPGRHAEPRRPPSLRIASRPPRIGRGYCSSQLRIAVPGPHRPAVHVQPFLSDGRREGEDAIRRPAGVARLPDCPCGGRRNRCCKEGAESVWFADDHGSFRPLGPRSHRARRRKSGQGGLASEPSPPILKRIVPRPPNSGPDDRLRHPDHR